MEQEKRGASGYGQLFWLPGTLLTHIQFAVSLYTSNESGPKALVLETKDNLTSHSCPVDVLKPDLMVVNANNWIKKH